VTDFYQVLNGVEGFPSKVLGFVILRRDVRTETGAGLVWVARAIPSATALATVRASSSVVKVRLAGGGVGEFHRDLGGGDGGGGGGRGRFGGRGGSPPPNIGGLGGDGDSAGRRVLRSGLGGTVGRWILMDRSSAGPARSCRRALAKLDVDGGAGLRHASGSGVERPDA